MVVTVIVMLAIIILDRVVKMWTTSYFEVLETMPVIKDVFHLTYVRNTGAAFSFLNEHTWILIVLTVIFCFVLLYFVLQSFQNSPCCYPKIAGVCQGKRSQATNSPSVPLLIAPYHPTGSDIRNGGSTVYHLAFFNGSFEENVASVRAGVLQLFRQEGLCNVVYGTTAHASWLPRYVPPQEYSSKAIISYPSV